MGLQMMSLLCLAPAVLSTNLKIRHCEIYTLLISKHSLAKKYNIFPYEDVRSLEAL